MDASFNEIKERRTQLSEEITDQSMLERSHREMGATWEPHEKHGDLTMKSDLPDSVFAFPNERKEPLTDAQHVRNAVARFDQVIGVSDEERALAFANIEKAANYYGVDLSETSWQQLGVHPTRRREREEA
jgi:hypothetical protein